MKDIEDINKRVIRQMERLSCAPMFGMPSENAEQPPNLQGNLITM